MDRTTPPPPPPPRRLSALDFVVFGAIALLVIFIAYRVNGVLVYHWDWSRVFGFVVRFDEGTGTWVSNLLLQGLATTLRLAFWATILATIIGGVMGYCRTSSNLTLRILSRSYVELVRNIPPVVFIFIFYYFISSQLFPAIGLDSIDRNSPLVDNSLFVFAFGSPALIDNFIAGVVCLALFEGAYITEIVRAGIQSVEKGQWEAARAIGLSPFNVLRDVVMPQAVRRILPPLAGQFITLIKDSAIVSLISIQELTYLATEVAASTTRVFETWILVAGLYFVLCYSFAVLFARLEARARKSRR
ncbi:MAG: ABC transporter permease subunit [Rhizobiales bacterium]|nr:ABC transporter permease subunit [Hyphomicrobiales bacterium]